MSNYWKKWMKAAGVRALRTAAQAAIAGVGTSMVVGEVNWTYVMSTAALAAILSVLTALSGLPEVEAETPSFGYHLENKKDGE